MEDQETVKQQVPESPSAPLPGEVKPSFVDLEPSEKDKTRKELRFTKRFRFEFYSSIDEKTYSGDFVCRRLPIGARGQVDVTVARLNGGMGEIDPQTHVLHSMIAYCSFSLIEAPAWWIPAEFYDYRVLMHVYDFVRQWESSFRR